MAYLRHFLMMIIVLASAMGIASAQSDDEPSGLTFVSVESAGENISVQEMIISPDASTLFWTELREFCVRRFDAPEDESCVPAPDALPSFIDFHWSPDSRYVAFTEDLFFRFHEPDIWLFDVEQLAFINRTDDGVAEVSRVEDNGAIPYTLPTWDPVNGDLYFFLQSFVATEPMIKLYSIPADELTSDTEPELIRDLSFVITTPISIYNIQIYSLDGGAAISPDGAQMAFLVRTTRTIDPENGVWLIDLDGGSFELLATYDDLRAVGLPEWANEQGRQIPESVGWINDTTLAVVMIDESLSGQLGVEMFLLFIDTVEREITPAKDFSDLPDVEAFFRVGDDGYAPSYDVPRADVILPHEETILYFNRDSVNSAFGASMIAFGSGDFTPIHIVTMTPEEFVPRLPIHRATVGDDGKTVRALLYGYLFTFERN